MSTDERSIQAHTDEDSGQESSHDEEETGNPANADADERNRRRFADSILRSVDKYMESKNNTFEKKMERYIEKSTDATVKKAAKKIKTDAPEFSRPGCKDQYKHNLAVLERIETAEKHIREAELKEALEELDAGKKEILKRQKLVLLADREENGWGFVKEYVRDELASGTDDEKHMSKARTVSTQKRKARNTQRFSSYKSQPYQSTSHARRGAHKDTYAKANFSERFSDRSTTNFRGQDFRKNKYDRQCYGCGRRGHLLSFCPESRNNRYYH